ncbi:MGH1-like glycoside hydrolase domain-containing protein [Paenarthrobacter nicotinovorans]|uniref:MGH1-like glycoside hydrolase domain-containing protein n=1 Tax=Paenarthrobacter nicotinovorans TaxID=29320 RepID=UPI0035946913
MPNFGRTSPISTTPGLWRFTALRRWTHFWLTHRTSPDGVLPYYQHGNDRGWDNSTTFDKDRLIQSPDLAAFLDYQLDVLIEIALELNTGEDGLWHGHRDRLFRGLMGPWGGDAFRAYAPITERWSTSSSLLNLLPLVISDRLPTEISQAMAARLPEYLTPWGLATEPPTSPHYEADGYWRGPIWPRQHT